MKIDANFIAASAASALLGLALILAPAGCSNRVEKSLAENPKPDKVDQANEKLIQDEEQDAKFVEGEEVETPPAEE